jgi:rubrerythrin
MGIDAGKNSADIVKVLELCRDVEAASAELYKYFAEIYSDHPELAALWRKTAKEEEDHAKQFVLALKMRREPFIDAIVIDGSKAENALKIVRSLNDMARKSPPGMLEALRAAIKLEKGLADFHMSTAVHFVQENQKQLFLALMRADNEHVEALEKFYQRLFVTD